MEKISNLEKPFLLLRRATLEDVPSLLKIERALPNTNTFSPILDEDEWRKEIKNTHVFFIDYRSVIAGYISYEQKAKDYVYISGLVVHPLFQGKGIGRQAMICLLDLLKHTKRIDLVTHPDNKASLGLYQSLGFVVESRKENYYNDGEPRLVLVLKRKD